MSYGWTGTGTGLRKGAVARPLTIPQKKNLSGLGNDRDEAFPFWDHLFAAASKAITIKVSSDDDVADETEDPSPSASLARTTTGILSNRRPVFGTPASASGNTTPSLVPDPDGPSAGAGRSSLLATAKREAAKRGLYAQFFRGPVLGPDDSPDARAAPSPSHSAPSPSSSPGPPSLYTPIPERVVVESTRSRKRKSEDSEERRERKRLKRERSAARAAKEAGKALAEDKGKRQKERKAQKHQEKTWSEEDATTPRSKKVSKQARNPIEGSVGDDLERAECTPKMSGGQPTSTNDGQQDRPPRHMDATDASSVAPVTKKKGKRKATLS